MRAPVLALAFALGACDAGSRPATVREVRARDAAAAAPDAAAAPTGPRGEAYADLAAALERILRDRPRVLGIGELHVRTDRGAALTSALARFSADGLPAIAGRVSDLVLETWMVDPACKPGAAATARVESAMKRPASTKTEIGGLFGLTKASSIKAHVMRLTCDDLVAVAPATAPDGGPGELDAEKLLGLVTRELSRITRSAIRYRDERQEARPLIVVYGGALHNDLYPYKATAQWSYAREVDAAAGGRYVEVDLFLPELLGDNPLYRQEPWFAVAEQAPADKVLVIERAPHSYAVILPRG